MDNEQQYIDLIKSQEKSLNGYKSMVELYLYTTNLQEKLIAEQEKVIQNKDKQLEVLKGQIEIMTLKEKENEK